MSEIISHRLLARLATFVAISTLEPCVVLGQVEHELRAHGVAALRHAEHVEGGRVGERHVAQLGAGDAQALRGICRHKEGEAYSVQLRTPPKSPHSPSIIFFLSIAQFLLTPALSLSDGFSDNCGPLCFSASPPPPPDSVLVPS